MKTIITTALITASILFASCTKTELQPVLESIVVCYEVTLDKWAVSTLDDNRLLLLHHVDTTCTEIDLVDHYQDYQTTTGPWGEILVGGYHLYDYTVIILDTIK